MAFSGFASSSSPSLPTVTAFPFPVVTLLIAFLAARFSEHYSLNQTISNLIRYSLSSELIFLGDDRASSLLVPSIDLSSLVSFTSCLNGAGFKVNSAL